MYLGSCLKLDIISYLLFNKFLSSSINALNFSLCQKKKIFFVSIIFSYVPFIVLSFYSFILLFVSLLRSYAFIDLLPFSFNLFFIYLHSYAFVYLRLLFIHPLFRFASSLLCLCSGPSLYLHPVSSFFFILMPSFIFSFHSFSFSFLFFFFCLLLSPLSIPSFSFSFRFFIVVPLFTPFSLSPVCFSFLFFLCLRLWPCISLYSIDSFLSDVSFYPFFIHSLFLFFLFLFSFNPSHHLLFSNPQLLQSLVTFFFVRR